MQDVLDLIKPSNVKLKKILQFKVLIFIICFIGFFKVFYNGNYVNIISLLSFVYFIVNIYLKKEVNTNTDFNQLIDKRLNHIQEKINLLMEKKILLKKVSKKKDKEFIRKTNQMSSLYIDANMITFLESIIEMYDYNPEEYYQLIKGTNNILKIRLDIEIFLTENNQYLSGIHQQLDIVNQLRINCINNIHNFIYNVPKITKMTKYINDIITRYTELIDSNVNIIKEYAQNNILENGINNTTQFIDTLDAKPNLELNSRYFYYYP
jgi:hypothetical protein